MSARSEPAALDLARANDARFLLASTSEVYGDPLVHPQVESYLGNVDPVGPRAVYDEAKRFAETLTMTYHRLYDLPTRIVRIFNTYGPRLRPADGRVVSNFLAQAIDGKPLTVYGTGTQTRSFCYVDDEVRGILALFDSDVVEPVNIGNPDRVHDVGARGARVRGHGLDRGAGVRAAARGRPRAAPTRHHARASSCNGSRRSSCARVSSACTPGTWRSALVEERDAVPPKIRKLSVIVPVYNERNTVVEVVRRMRAVELPDGIEREIIVVDDGSSDGTRDVLRQLGDSTVRILVHEGNRGKGAAVRTGLALATGDYVLIQDADLEYDPDDWPRLIAPVMRGRARRVRLAIHRRAPQHAAAPLDRQPHAVAGHQRPLQLDALRHGDLLQARRPDVARRARAPVGSLRHRAGDHREDPEARIRIYEVPISYMGREFDEGKKITWRDGFAALWTLVKFRFGD